MDKNIDGIKIYKKNMNNLKCKDLENIYKNIYDIELKHFNIQSSFSSYSSTGNYYSTSNINYLIMNLNLGCRLIHLDINYKTIDGIRTPIVTNVNEQNNKFEMNTYLKFDKCCEIIAEYGYNQKHKSLYPLILFLNLNYKTKYLDVSNRISKSIITHLKDYLLPIKYAYGNTNLPNTKLKELIFEKDDCKLGHIIIIKNYNNNNVDENKNYKPNNIDNNKRVDTTSLEELTNGYLKIIDIHNISEVNKEDELIGITIKNIYYGVNNKNNKYIYPEISLLQDEKLNNKLIFLIPELENGKANLTNNLYNFELNYLLGTDVFKKINNNINFIMNQYVSKKEIIQKEIETNIFLKLGTPFILNILSYNNN